MKCAMSVVALFALANASRWPELRQVYRGSDGPDFWRWAASYENGVLADFAPRLRVDRGERDSYTAVLLNKDGTEARRIPLQGASRAWVSPAGNRAIFWVDSNQDRTVSVMNQKGDVLFSLSGVYDLLPSPIDIYFEGHQYGHASTANRNVRYFNREGRELGRLPGAWVVPLNYMATALTGSVLVARASLDESRSAVFTMDRSGEVMAFRKYPEPFALDAAPNGRVFAVAMKGQVDFFDLDGAVLYTSEFSPGSRAAPLVAFSPTGQYVAVAHTSDPRCALHSPEDTALSVVHTLSYSDDWDAKSVSVPGPINSLLFSHNGRHLMALTSRGKIILVDSRSGQLSPTGVSTDFVGHGVTAVLLESCLLVRDGNSVTCFQLVYGGAE